MSAIAQTRPSDAAAVQRVLSALRERFGARMSTAIAVRDQHARGEGIATSLPPDAVIWPENKDEVSAVVALCNENRIPVIAFGAGTSLEGHVSAPHGGLCVDLSRMNAGDRDPRRGRDCVGAARHHARGAERLPQGHGPLLPRRPGRERDDRRDDLDARVGYHHDALRLDVAQRDGARGRASPTGASCAWATARASLPRATTSCA